MQYTTKQLSEITNAQLIGDSTIIINNISFDSRNIYSINNTAFLALSTKKNSGEKYIPQVAEKGINVIISEKHYPDVKGVTWLITENVLDFLRNLAKFYFEQYPNLSTIGITGSNGKTIVKEWLYQSLNSQYNIVKSPKSFNSQIGLPLSLLQISKNHNLGIFEVGISMPGEMQKQTSIFSPSIGVLTHIGSAHLSNFSSVHELIEDKISLFENSPVIIYQGDNPLVQEAIEKRFINRTLISYGFKEHNQVRIIGDYHDKKREIDVVIKGKKLSFPAAKRDHATLYNALCIISVMNHLEIPFDKIRESLIELRSVEMRLESVNGLRDNLIVNDSFNLDLDSLKIAFEFIGEYNKPQKCLVLTDFAEGGDNKSLYREVIRLTNLQDFDKLFLIGPELRQIQKEFNSQTYTFDNTQELILSKELSQVENSLILLKGARKFEIEKVKDYLALQKHDTVLEINLNAILHNINFHKSYLDPRTKMMAMVKAYSYGLGGYEIAEFLEHHHIDYLGVAYVDEGVDLRKHGISTPIMVVNPEQHSYGTIIDFNLEPEIYSFRVLELFAEQLKEKGYTGNYPIHIKVETGMHRLGFKKEDLTQLKEKLKGINIEVKSIFSHLSSADDPNEEMYSLQQINAFEQFTNELTNGLGYLPLRHILNSSGIQNYSNYQYEMVRIGIGMLGISSNQEIETKLQGAVSLKTVISQISEVKKGESIGYGRMYKPSTDTKIATVPVGYADGLPRLIGNKAGKLIINNTLVPIVGNVCMDMLMLDIGDLNVSEGDEVVVFNSSSTLKQFANYCQTIPYEVLTSISRRVKRIYIKN